MKEYLQEYDRYQAFLVLGRHESGQMQAIAQKIRTFDETFGNAQQTHGDPVIRFFQSSMQLIGLQTNRRYKPYRASPA